MKGRRNLSIPESGLQYPESPFHNFPTPLVSAVVPLFLLGTGIPYGGE